MGQEVGDVIIPLWYLLQKKKERIFLTFNPLTDLCFKPFWRTHCLLTVKIQNTAHWQVWFHEAYIRYYTRGGKVDNLLSHIIRYCTWWQGYIYVTTHEQLGRHPSVPMNYNEAPPGTTKHHQAHSFGLPGERWGCLCVALAVPVFANQRKDFSKKYEQN